MKFLFFLSQYVQFSFTKFPFCFDPSQSRSSDHRIFYSHQAYRPVCQRRNRAEATVHPALVALAKASEIYVASVVMRVVPSTLQLVLALRVLILLRPKKRPNHLILVFSILVGQLETVIAPNDARANWHLCPIPTDYSHSTPSHLQLSDRALSLDCNLEFNF